MPLNLHGLFAGAPSLPGFREGINLPEPDEAVLQEARDDIRMELKAKFRAISDAEPLRKAFIVEGSLRAAFGDRLKGLRITPKFHSQGSYVYKTLNDPVADHVPPQQVDLDDGVFLPTSFVNEERPIIAAKAYFKAVEEALEPLCKRKGWRLNRAKSSCVRVHVGAKIHIDLPLYAIPDKDFEQIVERMAKAHGMEASIAMDASILLDEEYAALPDDQIMLAERNGTWRRSDPRALERWFVAAVERHGEALRHVARYLKAWRDHQWKDPNDGIPSITIMAITVNAFDAVASRPPAEREDLALKMVADAMPGALGKTIENPVVEGETLDEGWSREMRKGFVERAKTLCACISAAVEGSSSDAAIVRMRACLGARVPDEPTLVKPDGYEAAVLASPRKHAPAPVVVRSVSG